MTGKAKLRIIVNILMTASLLLLMAYSLIGTDWHEYIGIFMFVLFMVHHFLSRSWSRNVLRGRYGDIHFNTYIPKSYDGSKAYALYVTLPGYEHIMGWLFSKERLIKSVFP